MKNTTLLAFYNLIKINPSPEIWLKSRKVKIRMLKALMNNIKNSLKHAKITFHKFQLSKDSARIFFFFKNEDIKKATEGKSVAISIDGPTVGRQIKEGDILYVDIPESQARIINYQFKDQLTPSESKALEELVKIKRKTYSYWGM